MLPLTCGRRRQGDAERNTTIRPIENTVSSATGYRADIQGLRAIAVTLVVAYHLLPKALTGGYIGVDVFFVISGFLITGHLLSKPPTTPRLLGQFWARRIRRLLPAAFTVILATFCLTWFLAPESRWRSVSWDGIASAFYFQNWRLAASSTDYLGAEEAASPLQHFWSLSVEEQFYVVWPILILIVLAVAARGRWKPRVLVTSAILVVTIASFGYGLYLTHVEPAAAYFVTTTRVWELGLGAVLACVGQLWRPGRVLGIVAAWLGVLLIAFAAATYTSGTPFPGSAAAVPTLGAVLIIWAGSTSRWSPTGVLGVRPVQWVGDASYSIYLWHWPLISLIPLVGNGHLGWIDAMVIIAATLVLSAITKTYVEDRFRNAPILKTPPRSFVMGLTSMGLVGAIALVPMLFLNGQQRASDQAIASARVSTETCVGARSLDHPLADCPVVPQDSLVPDPAVAADDKADAYPDGCWEQAPYPGLRTCTYGTGKRQVALVGNSHAGQWLPAFQKIADENGMTITTFLASSCAPIDADLAMSERNRVGCRQWGQKAVAATKGKKFDLVVVTARNVNGVVGSDKDSFFSGLANGYSALLKDWKVGGTNLLVLHDTPFPASSIESIPDCLAQKGREVRACSGKPKDWIPEDPLFEAAKKSGSGVHAADLNDHICRPDRCYGANGGIVTYFDGSHLTATYAATLSPYLEPEVLRALKQ